MADKLIETDVEKAGIKYGPGRTKFGQKNLNPSKTMRRHGFRMSDSQHAHAQSMYDKFGEKGVRQYLRNRPELRGKVRKSADPVETLYAEIEKARGLLPAGKVKTNTFRRNAGTTRATARLSRALDRHHNGKSLNATGRNAPTRKRVMGYRLQNALKYLGQRSKRNTKTQGLSAGDR